MKKFISTVLALITALSLVFPAFAASESLAIVSGDGLKSVIIIPAEAEDYEHFAAETLQKYIFMMTGEKLEIHTDDEKIGGNKIFVGNTVYADFDFSEMKKGSYRITSDSSCVKICGKGTTGTVAGAYAFLEKFCGLKIFTKDVMTIDRSYLLSVPTGIDITYQPYFSARRVDTDSVYDLEYALANGINNSWRMPENVGGSIPYLGNFCHSLANTFCNPDVYFDAHPEYFALHDGKRNRGQLCLTNDDVLKIVTAEVLEVLRNECDPNADLQIVSVTQNDNQDFCECEKCAAIDNENGSHSGTMLTFVNKIAASVKEAGYDNVAVDTFAYQYTRKAPTKVMPADNVIVRLCSIECCFGHALEDAECKENVNFMKDLDEWSKICKKLYIWDYVNNYSETLCPFANFQVLQKNVQTFYEHNAIGVYEEGNYYMAECDGEFAELRSYMLSQFLEDPYCDGDKVMNDYLKAYYGDGWESIKEYINIISKHSVTKNKHLYIRQQPRQSLPGMTAKEITLCDEIWKTAKDFAKAANDGSLERIERSELNWLYWKCTNYKKEFSIFHDPYTFMKNREDLYNKMKSFGIKRLGEYANDGKGGDMKVLVDTPSLCLLMPCDYWEAKHINSFWQNISPFVVWLYGVFKSVFAH